MDLSRISEITEGQLIGVGIVDAPNIVGLSNDTRKDCEQRLYVAIEGPNFDGHNYIAKAQNAGASAVLVEKFVDVDLPRVQVNNAVQAMGKIAAEWRKDFDIPILAITGSAGKTTLKELSGSVLSQSRKGIITKGNLNNEIGVPLTLTRLSKGDEFAVIEMGMNHAGEIDYLSRMTSPDIAIINNAAAAHLDDLGSIEAVANAKGEIVSGLKEDGILILNADDEYANLWRKLAGSRRTVSFGLSEAADVYASYESTVNGTEMSVAGCYGEIQIQLPLHGEHNVRNALAVIAATHEMGCSKLDIKIGLEVYEPLLNRGGSSEFDGLKLIDDTYNANPVSMKAAIDVVSIESKLARSQGKKVSVYLVFGDMGELGGQQSALHEQVGRAAIGVAQHFYCCGNHSDDYLRGYRFNNESGKGLDFQTVEPLTEHLSQQLSSRNKDELSIVLVKGSRFTGMERVVHSLVQLEQKIKQRSEDVK
jgi:UDP-N-acetylmuramoyl-tripeptide--D-alanyl-D-alanine ligase